MLSRQEVKCFLLTPTHPWGRDTVDGRRCQGIVFGKLQFQEDIVVICIFLLSIVSGGSSLTQWFILTRTDFYSKGWRRWRISYKIVSKNSSQGLHFILFAVTNCCLDIICSIGYMPNSENFVLWIKLSLHDDSVNHRWIHYHSMEISTQADEAGDDYEYSSRWSSRHLTVPSIHFLFLLLFLLDSRCIGLCLRFTVY